MSFQRTPYHRCAHSYEGNTIISYYLRYLEHPNQCDVLTRISHSYPQLMCLETCSKLELKLSQVLSASTQAIALSFI